MQSSPGPTFVTKVNVKDDCHMAAQVTWDDMAADVINF
jgi:hypothetical protein